MGPMTLKQVQKLSVGSIPRSLVVVLEDDLVDSCKSGKTVACMSLCHICLCTPQANKQQKLWYAVPIKEIKLQGHHCEARHEFLKKIDLN